jgi:hypothetical protein
LACWGHNGIGHLNGIPTGTLTQVSAGASHTCALRTGGTLACWGSNLDDQNNGTPTAGTFTQVSAGLFHSCSLRPDGTLACWGGDDFDQATPPAGTFTQVSAGGRHTCGLRTAGTLACWGYNASGQTDVPPELAGIVETAVTFTISPTTQQYSDSVTLSASLTPSDATGSVEFFLVQGLTETSLGSADVSSGAASLKVQVTSGAGTATYKAVFTGTGTFAGSENTADLTVTKEDAVVLYDGANPAALQVSTAGGELNAGALTLALEVKEKTPDAATAPGSAGIGSIANAGLGVTLVPVGPGSSFALNCAATGVSGTGYDAARAFSCMNDDPLPVNSYEVQASVSGDYYTGDALDAFTVFDPSLGFASGGGAFVLDGEKVGFGFTTKYKKKGTNMQGALIVLRHHADGTVSRLKSNALGSLALGEDASVPMGWASFDGKATYTTWDEAAGDYVTVGNQGFAVYVEDRDNPGDGTDRIWLAGPGTLTLPGALSTASQNAAALTGGDISVPHKAGGKKKK